MASDELDDDWVAEALAQAFFDSDPAFADPPTGTEAARALPSEPVPPISDPVIDLAEDDRNGSEFVDRSELIDLDRTSFPATPQRPTPFVAPAPDGPSSPPETPAAPVRVTSPTTVEDGPAPVALEAPVVEPPVAEAPVVEPPTVEPPAVEPPVVEAPVVEPPAFEAPVVEPPVVERPPFEPPVVEAPVVEPPAFEAPVLEPPVVDSPVLEPLVVDAPVVEPPLGSPVIHEPAVDLEPDEMVDDHVDVDVDVEDDAGRSRTLRGLVEWVVVLVGAVVVALLLRAFLIHAYWIPSESMEATLQEQDRVLVNKLSYRLHDVNRGDVVVFRRPDEEEAEIRDLIKRVIALEGETVEARDNQIFVDGRALTEPYLAPDEVIGAFDPTTVPEGHVFVMGDNRDESYDSRFFGTVDEDRIEGRAFVLFWPLNRVGTL